MGRRDPEYVTTDFSNAWERGVKVVFPRANIIICTFHAVQLLTRGLLKELNRLQRANNTNFIKECGAARKWSLERERGAEGSDMPPTFTQEFCRGWAGVFALIAEASAISNADAFHATCHELLTRMREWNLAVAGQYETQLASSRPKRGFSSKGLEKFTGEMKKKWRAVLRGARHAREEKKKEFAGVKFLLVKRSENLSKRESTDLDLFLQANAWAREVRDTLLRFYALLDDPKGNDLSLDFLDALVKAESHDWLKSAVSTLKAKKDHVFNFVNALQAHPSWKDLLGFKVNPEHVMKKVNAVARTQYSFRSDASARFKLSRALSCPVIISKSVINAENGDQVLN